jgi:hypothetical protein
MTVGGPELTVHCQYCHTAERFKVHDSHEYITARLPCLTTTVEFGRS